MNLINFIDNLIRWSKPSLRDAVPVPIGRLYVCVQNPDGKIVKVVRSRNLRTNAGRDWQAAQMGGTAVATAQYIATSESSTAPLASDTTLSGELSTSGLTRKLGSYSHTAGALTYLITASFTVTGTKTVRTLGLFNASSVGTLCFESSIPAVTVSSGQIFSVFWSIDLGA